MNRSHLAYNVSLAVLIFLCHLLLQWALALTHSSHLIGPATTDSPETTHQTDPPRQATWHKRKSRKQKSRMAMEYNIRVKSLQGKHIHTMKIVLYYTSSTTWRPRPLSPPSPNPTSYAQRMVGVRPTNSWVVLSLCVTFSTATQKTNTKWLKII